MTSRLWVPSAARYREPRVAREHMDTAWTQQAEVLAVMHQHGGILDHWNRELKRVDARLRLMQAFELADVPGVRPGFYHLVRLNDRPPPWVQVITGPAGEFAEPTSQMLDSLKAADLQNPAAVRERMRHDELAAKRAEHVKAHERELRVDEGVERLDAYTRTQISVSDAAPWAQNFAGTRRPTRGKGK